MRVLECFGQFPPCVFVIKGCGGALFCGGEIGRLGHDVRLIPPAHANPFVKSQKNDMADAEAICEVAQRLTLRFEPVNSEEVRRAAMVFLVREALIGTARW